MKELTTFLPVFKISAKKKCCSEYDGGILIHNEVPHCRWCKTAFITSSSLHCAEEDFATNSISDFAESLFSIHGVRTDFENYLMTQYAMKKIKSEKDELMDAMDEMMCKVNELIRTNQELLAKNAINFSGQIAISDNTPLSDEEKLEFRKNNYVQALLGNIRALELNQKEKSDEITAAKYERDRLITEIAKARQVQSGSNN